MRINLGWEISFYLSLLLSRYIINDWSMASDLLFRFKLWSLPTTPCISRIYTVRSWWASRINHPTWVHRANMNFCRNVSSEEYYSISPKANYTICIISINLITMYIIYCIIHNLIFKLILHAIDAAVLRYSLVAFSVFPINIIINHLHVSLASKFQLIEFIINIIIRVFISLW